MSPCISLIDLWDILLLCRGKHVILFMHYSGYSYEVQFIARITMRKRMYLPMVTGIFYQLLNIHINSLVYDQTFLFVVWWLVYGGPPDLIPNYDIHGMTEAAKWMFISISLGKKVCLLDIGNTSAKGHITYKIMTNDIINKWPTALWQVSSAGWSAYCCMIGKAIYHNVVDVSHYLAVRQKTSLSKNK